MIKRKRKEFKIIGLCVILALLFLCAFNVTYSYFTAISSITGQMNFYDLNVKFGRARGSTEFTTIEGATLVVAPNKIISDSSAASIIARGDTFSLKTLVNNAYVDVDYLYFRVEPNSCDSYVRFMLDAYKLNADGTTVDTSVNYGQYFLINNSTSAFTTKLITNSNVTNTVYYMTNALIAGANIYRFCDSITLLDSAPVDILDGKILLTISFKAVQKANKAYQSVFNDGWEYLDSWV